MVPGAPVGKSESDASSTREIELESWPLTGYRGKGNCSALEVAPSPNWVPCRVLDGDIKTGPCAPVFFFFKH